MSTIKSSSEDLTLNADGSNDIKFQSNGVEKASISSAGAFTSTTIDATKLTGEKRNFIIDGDFTQWPDGTSQTGLGALKTYVSALWFSQLSSTVGRGTGSRDTDVPTLAESGHQSAYSLKWDCTTIDASPTTTDLLSYVYVITGSDYANLHGGKEMTFSFWHKHTKTGVQSGSFQNSARNRSYIFTYEQTVSNTWEKATINFTTDTTGTWLFTEADVGMRISLMILTGGSFSDTTADTWLAQDERGHDSQVNNVDSTSNNMLFSQFCLRFGNSGEFTSPPVSTVQDQVEYYYQSSYTNGTAPGTVTGVGGIQWLAWAGSGQNGHMNFARLSRTMRATPSITMYSPGTGATGKGRNDSTAADFDSGVGGSIENQKGFRYDINTTLVAGHQVRQHFIADARH